MNNKYTRLYVENISIIFFDSLMLYCYKSNTVLFMTYLEYIYSFCLIVDQMVLLSVRGGFVDDAKYLFSPVAISSRSLSYLIGRKLYALWLAQIICTFSYPSFRVSNIYEYLSLRYAVKYDKATLMITKTIQSRMYFILVLSLHFSTYHDVSRWYILDFNCGCFISFLLNHHNIQNTWVCYCLSGGRMFQIHGCFWSIGSWFFNEFLLIFYWLVLLSIV